MLPTPLPATLVLASLILLPVVAGLLLVLAAGRRTGWAVAGPGLAVATATVALAAGAAAGRPTASAPFVGTLAFSFGVDGLSAVLVVTIAVVTALVLLGAVGEPALRRGRFVGVVLVFAGAMLATVTATTLPALLGGWEVMGATSWLLIAHRRREPGVGSAATTAFLTTRTADVGLYVAAGAALAGGVGSLALADLPRAGPGWLTLVVVGVVVAALGKSAQLPFSSWLSRAMVGPAPVSALLHSATMVAAGAYLLVRLGPLLGATAWAGPLVAALGGATAVVLGLVATVARDLKQLLAASTASTVGTMVLGAGVAASSPGATVPSAALLVGHAAVKSLLFLAAGAWLVTLRTRDLAALRGAARRHRTVGVTFTVGALALAGTPPLSLWWAKDGILAAVTEGSGAFVVLGEVSAVLSAVAATRAMWFVWRPARGLVRPARHTPRTLMAALVVLAVPAAALGGVAVALGLLPRADAGTLGSSAALVVPAVGMTWALHSRPIRQREAWGRRLAGAARGWWGLDAAVRVTVVRPVLALAVLLDRADGALDRGVRAAAGGVLVAADAVEERGEPVLRSVVGRLGGATRRLGAAARRPQTGQLHQYYAQTAAGLGLVVVLAVVLVVAGVR